MSRLKCMATIVAAAFALAPLGAVAASSSTPSPSPSLDTVLAKPPAADFNDLTSSPLNGRFTAHDFASLNGSGSTATDTENTLKHDGFVDGYGRTWAQASTGHGLIEAVMAFTGRKGAKDALTGLEQGDKADSSYKHADTIDGISPYYGAHFVDSSTNVTEDLYSFVKGNDLYAVLFVSSKDDVANLAVTQTKAQYGAAPQSTIPSSQWPENARGGTASFPVAAFVIGAAFVVVVVALVAFFLLRRRTPAMAGGYPATGAYPMVGAPGAVTPQAVQMSPDGNYWWDGQAWRDAGQEAPPDAQRSSDGSLWWDGGNWRPVPQAAQPEAPQAQPPQGEPPPA